MGSNSDVPEWWSVHLPAEDLDFLHNMILGGAIPTLAMGLWTWLTFALFAEKRQAPLMKLVFLFATVALLLNAVFMISGADRAQTLGTDRALCGFQATAVLFLGNNLVATWLGIFIMMWMRIYYDGDDDGRVPFSVAVSFSLIYSIVMATCGLLSHERYEYDGVWCFLGVQYWGLITFCYFGGMSIACITSIILWCLMIHKLYQAKRFSNAESSRLLSDYVPTTSTPSSPAQVNGKNGYTAINHRTRAGSSTLASTSILSSHQSVLMRQLIFATCFVFSFIALSVNYYLCYLDPGYLSTRAWKLQIVVISAASFMVFVVFGLTKRNLELWKELLFARKAGPISINASA